jgi:hypothetical protein
MSCLSRTRLPLVALGAVLALAPAVSAQDAKKGDSKQVTIQTTDGVELQGTFYPGKGGKHDAVVLLLHNIDMRKGGDSHADGWDSLAEALQADGYAVLSFDFRGFGNSKSVNKELFWKFPHNSQALRGAARMSATIDHKEFPPQYYPTLVNDISAAKSYLDRKNDGGEVNTSNLIVIGAGQGATLGAMWMASSCHLQKDKASLQLGQPLDLAEPECKDLTAGVWLSISPSLGGQTVPLRGWLTEVARDNKVPMAFIYGKKDQTGQTLAKGYLTAIRTPKPGAKVEKLELTDEKPIADTNLAGSQLLQSSLGTEKWIVGSYLFKITEKPQRERRKRDSQLFRYFWTFSRAPFLAKNPGEELPRPVPTNWLLGR